MLILSLLKVDLVSAMATSIVVQGFSWSQLLHKVFSSSAFTEGIRLKNVNYVYDMRFSKVVALPEV